MSDEKPVNVKVKEYKQFRGSINQFYKIDRNDNDDEEQEETKLKYDVKIQNEEKLGEQIPGLSKSNQGEKENGNQNNDNLENKNASIIKTKYWVYLQLSIFFGSSLCPQFISINHPTIDKLSWRSILGTFIYIFYD